MLAYYKPTTIEEAIKLKAENPKSAYLGGGTILNSLSWTKFVESGRVEDYESLIDISELDMGTIEEKDGFLRIGANVRFQDMVESPLCPKMLRLAFKQFASRNVRNVATFGGSLAVKSPCANSNAALMAMHAEMEVVNASGTKRLSVEEFVQSQSSADDSLIVAIYVPLEWTKINCATRRYSRSHNDISIVLADIILEVKDERVSKISAVAGGVAPKVVRLKALEEALLNGEIPDSDKVNELVQKDIAPIDDIRGSAAFKAYMIGQLIDWCLHQAKAGADCCCEHKG